MRSGAISLRTSAHAQPMDVWPDGYEPSFSMAACSAGVQIGSLPATNGRVRL